ncbi:MAG: NYN domain-containing protein [Pirellulales bacterium]|nr:NYN domain-containing protein [Pirellulales bacterium]
MWLVIDGYNLAYEVGWLTPRSRGPGALERARQRLLSFLAHSLDEDAATKTTVVFDAKQSPPGSVSRSQPNGIKVLFAENHEDADALIEELIRQSGTPKKLTVVSSDLRIVTAAKRRKARSLTSAQWYKQTIQQRKQRQAQTQERDLAKQDPSTASDEERDYWLKKFS